MKNWGEQKEVLLEGLASEQVEGVDRLLENQRSYLNEAAAAGTIAASNVQSFETMVLPLIRRVAPALLANQLVGVQPMKQPVGFAATLRHVYKDAAGAGLGSTAVAGGEEIWGQNIFDKYSLIAAGEAYDAADARTNGEIFTALESQGGNKLGLEIVKQSFEVKSRKLQARWSIESDLKSADLYGVNIQEEMTVALGDEIQREKDRELLTALTALAIPATFDFAAADGRYAGEKFTSVGIHLSSLSSQIAVATRKSGATWMVVSNDVLIALRNANGSAFVPAQAEISPGTTAFVGTFNGQIKAFLDVHAPAGTILMGYKGTSAVDTGLIYCPYIELQISPVMQDFDTYDNRVGLMSMYSLVDFTDDTKSLGNSSDYYRRSSITNLTLGLK